ncbi:toxin-antitoxin system YwqK family antitoxin [Aquimarina pacifica]|uniref:toxin-antitoxin system YwqK family antitoxin n=1 Tax=Aquimarina pacifica TaxID=1296415 RepID=UPI0004B629A7|nr:toxin-antitoxin system YwqK family antitoxin [Aquimarina pacifica]
MFKKPFKNYYILIVPFLVFCVLGCTKTKKASNSVVNDDKEIIIIDDIMVPKDLLVLKPNEGKWYYQGTPFTGFAVYYHDNKQIAQKIGYYKGKKEGLAQKWFPNGDISKTSYYKQNRLDGIVRVWWPNKTISSESNYINGVKDGVQKKWYSNGQLGRKTTINKGKEEGLQQAWLQNGKLYVNYEARNGRVFGLKRANLCYKLKEEQVVFSEK